MLIVESILSFFVDKGADKFWEYQKDANEKKQMEQKIREFTERYYNERFYQIPLSKEFDYEGLNNFLYENLDNKVAVCFNAFDYKHRKFFKEQLFKEAYVYAKADTREKQNTVQFYIQSILNIIEYTFIERVNDKDWFLAGRMVDDVEENVEKLINKYSSQLEDFIRYNNSFADTIDSIIHHFDSDNEYHYLRKNIYFQGRKDALEYLDRFLAAHDELLFAVITGQGGIGKSKLMYYYMISQMSDLEWKIVFPSQQLIDLLVNQHNEWSYPRNLLVIIDYAGEIPDVVGRWINILNHTNKRPPKMRIVMLERQGIVTDSNGSKEYPYWYKQIREAAGQNFDKLLYERQFYSLKPLNRDDLFTLMNNIAENQGKQISREDRIAIYNRAEELGSPENINRFTTPLMVILLTDAFLDSKNLRLLNKTNLMEYIIDKYQKYWLRTICSGDSAQYEMLEKLLVYATATGGWDLKPLPEPLATTSVSFLKHYKKTNLRLILSGISEENNQKMSLSPFEPDIVGEYFVLWYLSECTCFNDFVKLLWSRPVNFTYFLNRCISSYLCDSDFDILVDGELSLFGEWGSPYLQALLLVNLSARLPLEKCRSVVRMLSAMTQDGRYSDDQDIVLDYARGLFNLSNKQDTSECTATIKRLAELAQDERYSDNQEIVLRYARGLFNLSYKQNTSECTATIKRLATLAQDGRYNDNQEIVLTYAQSLFNLSNRQDNSECEATIEQLATLAQDGRYSGNQEIVLTYAQSLVNLSNKQDASGYNATVESLKVLAQNENSDNQEIVLEYAKGLVNLSNKQDTSECAATIEQLAALAQDGRYSDNQEIVLRYARGLFNFSNKQDTSGYKATIGRLAALAQDGRYSDNQEIVLEYAQGLVNLSNKQDTSKCAATIEQLAILAQDGRYSDNQEIVLTYAQGLANLSNKQDSSEGATTIEQLAALAQDGRYSGNQEIILRYARGLFNVSTEQGASECAATIERLAELAQDGRYSNNQEIVLEYAKGLVNFSNKQDALVCAAAIERLAELAQDKRYSDNQEIVLTYAMGLFNLSNKQGASECAATIERLAELAQDGRYSNNQEIVLEYAKGLVNFSNKQDALVCAAAIERLAELAQDKRYSDNQEIVLTYAMGLFNLSNKQGASECAATIERLAALAQDERYSDNQEIVLTYAQSLRILGFNKYLNELRKEAGELFFHSFKLGDPDAGVNLFYMVRRKEYDLTNFSMEELLDRALLCNDAFALVNFALYTAINKENWISADRMIETISEDAINKILPWWKLLYDNNDPEGLLTIIWLERHGYLETGLLSNSQKCYNYLCDKYPGIPTWIVERNL